MRVLDIGQGVPLVVVPGIQGRWEWMAPAIDALAAFARVITFSLDDAHAGPHGTDPSTGFAGYVTQLRDAMDTAGVDRAVVVGISYGGLIAAEFAARHPDRLLGLVLVSAITPDWTPDARVRFYLRAPRLLTPLFLVTSPLRLVPEVWAACDTVRVLLQVAAGQAWRTLRAPVAPSRMADRIRRVLAHRFGTLPRTLPALVITGEPGLDRVVPTTVTRRYLDLLPQARLDVLARTGHLGVVTRAGAFAALVQQFVMHDLSAGPPVGRRISSSPLPP